MYWLQKRHFVGFTFLAVKVYCLSSGKHFYQNKLGFLLLPLSASFLWKTCETRLSWSGFLNTPISPVNSPVSKFRRRRLVWLSIGQHIDQTLGINPILVYPYADTYNHIRGHIAAKPLIHRQNFIKTWNQKKGNISLNKSHIVYRLVMTISKYWMIQMIRVCRSESEWTGEIVGSKKTLQIHKFVFVFVCMWILELEKRLSFFQSRKDTSERR